MPAPTKDVPPSPRRKRIRLAPEIYKVEGQPALVTVCTRGRRPILTAGRMPQLLRSALGSAAEHAATDVLVWCVMPDHLHALLQARPTGDLVQWVARFKGRVATDARNLDLRKIWQRGFHDRLLRKEEAVPAVVRYVLENPVRAGLARTWRDWPHSGSLTWDLETWVDLG